MKVHLTSGDALIVTDVQNDFLPGGSLAVAGGDEVVPALNRYIAAFHARELPIFATRDWHPSGHCSFMQQGGPWPQHCVANTRGAAFPEALALPPETQIISKADTREKDAYSGFGGSRLNELLQYAGSRRLFIGGLTTDYCVLNTVKDALALNYPTFLLEDAVRAVNVQAGDGKRALEEMVRLGAVPIRFDAIVA